MEKVAEKKLKEFDKELELNKREVENLEPLSWAGPFKVLIPAKLRRQIYSNAAVSELAYKIVVKYNIGVFKGCLILLILFLVFVIFVLLNNFYLKIFF